MLMLEPGERPTGQVVPVGMAAKAKPKARQTLQNKPEGRRMDFGYVSKQVHVATRLAIGADRKAIRSTN